MELRRATIESDTDPPEGGKRVPTDPGLGGLKGATDPGGFSKPPSDPPRAKADSLSDALTPVPPVKPHAGSPVVAAIERRGGPVQETTPVPPETTDLLSGLTRGENDAYFHKAKPAAESSGEAAAAFHAGPRTAPQPNDTPPPQPPVVLRKSVELDIAEVAKQAEQAPTDPTPSPPLGLPHEGVAPSVRRALAPRDLTVPLPPPRSPLGDKWIAFGVALVTVAAIGILLVRWLMPTSSTDVVPVSVGTETAPTVSPVPPTPSPPQIVTTSPALTTMQVAPPPPPPMPTNAASPPTNARPSRPTGGPTRTLPPPTPTESGPPPKDDVKRTM